LSTNAYLDLAHGHADLTVRPAVAMPNDLVGEVAAHLGMSVYSANKTSNNWVGVTGPLTRSVAGKWLFERCKTPRVLADSFLVLSELLASGAGQSVLPCFLGDTHPGLIRRSGDAPVLRVPIWVANHRELGDSRRISKFRRQLAKSISRQSTALLGDRSQT
jgi:DNA-binding transcriptional LysR family regulator